MSAFMECDSVIYLIGEKGGVCAEWGGKEKVEVEGVGAVVGCRWWWWWGVM